MPTTASPPELKIDTEAVNASSTPSSSSNIINLSFSTTPKEDSKDASVTRESTASGPDTFGKLNQHPTPQSSTDSHSKDKDHHHSSEKSAEFKVGVSVDRNRKCRRTMEDAHSFIYDFGGLRGQGYFAVFDGHAGKHAAEWCGHHFHEHLLSALAAAPTTTRIPDLLNTTFHTVDKKLSELAQKDGTHSGCTAVTAFLRLEDEDGNAVAEVIDTTSAHSVEDEKAETGSTASSASGSGSGSGSGGLRGKLREFLSSSHGSSLSPKSTPRSSPSPPPVPNIPPAKSIPYHKRTLYTANVGDARAVLSRGGRAVRLTYDHKGSDAKEAKRITDAGGFVMNNRVNGVLAVTRSLGDSSMKEFVVGSPYTTETTLGKDDQWLIVACDGLWDVCQDQEAVDIIKDLKDPQEASKKLLDHALQNFSTDNLSVLVISLL